MPGVSRALQPAGDLEVLYPLCFQVSIFLVYLFFLKMLTVYF